MGDIAVKGHWGEWRTLGLRGNWTMRVSDTVHEKLQLRDSMKEEHRIRGWALYVRGE